MIDEILFVTDVARQQVRHEQIGEGVFPMKRIHHCFLFDPQKMAVRHSDRRSDTESLAAQGALAKEIPLT